MKIFFLALVTFLLGSVAYGQNFPNSMKQPKQAEMKKQHRKFQSQSKRHRHNVRQHDAALAPKRRT